MKALKTTLKDCILGFKGQWFTWEMGRFVNTNIRGRLDRGVDNG